MIVNTTLNQDAEYLGDIQEHRVGIDKSNIDFITTLLTSNLYSKPLESFLRETVANAHDSHVEAGTSERILLLIEDVSYNTFRISIRDYGVGVSPERFETIYKNIGSSTKRQSNDYIGMFGIGRFSCLSCADTASITSYYNNVKYSYVMYKNGGGINIDKISETEGDFKTGLEVSIEKYITSIYNLGNSLNKLCLFEDLYISYTGNNIVLNSYVGQFNKRKITNFKTFSLCSILDESSNYFRVGNILYNNTDKRLSTKNGTIVNLPIGTVDITPNREELQFTNYTETEITSRIKDVKEEFQELLDSVISSNITLQSFAEIVSTGVYKFEIYGDNGSPTILKISNEDVVLNLSKLTIDREALPKDYLTFINNVRYVGIGKHLIHKVITPKTPYVRNPSTEIKHLLLGNYRLMQKGDAITKQVTFLYFTEFISTPTVILTYNGLKAWKNEIIEYAKKARVAVDVEACVDFTFRHIPMKTMLNSEVPDAYLDEYKKIQKEKRKKADTNKIPIRVYHKDKYHQDYFDTLPKKGLVIYTSHLPSGEDHSLKHLAYIVSGLPSIAAVITVKSEYIKLLEQDSRYMKLENFMYLKNNVFVKLFTAKEILDNFYTSQFNYGTLPIYKDFSSKYKNECIALRFTVVNSTMQDLHNYYKEKGWLNTYDISYFKISEEEAKALQYWETIISYRNSIIQALTYKKYGRLQRIGLTPTTALKLL